MVYPWHRDRYSAIMSSPPDSSPPNDAEDREFDRAISELEQSLQELKQRHEQVRRDTQRRSELQRRQAQLQAQLAEIGKQLDALEVNLESKLVSWSSFKEPFWQAVRFGGLGIVIGWILKSCAG